MQGLELCRSYYETYGKPLLEEQFAPYLGNIAIGLFGSGSECYGYDDAVSRDHDFEPGFCIFLPEEDVIDRKVAFQLERAYAKLPSEFEGVARAKMQPVGGSRHGVFRLSEFLQEKIGCADGILTTEQWLSTPSYLLAEMTNGEVFFDGNGMLSAIRTSLGQMPEDVRRKRLAGQLLLMAQAGQYNYQRCLKHGETGAAQMALFQFVEHAIEAAFLLNSKYAPYYKWSFRGLRSLPVLSEIADTLESLISSGNEGDLPEQKQDAVEAIVSLFIDALQDQGLTKAICGDLEKHAYSVNDSIEESRIRNLHILAAI